MRERKPVRAFGIIAGALALLIGGCAKNDGPVGAGGSGVPVNLTMSFSRSAGALSLFKSAGTTVADSIRIDSVVVVVEKIRFRSNADSVTIDSTGHDDHEDHDESFTSEGVTFQGPFVLHIQDTLAIDLASQLLPAGTYNGVSFTIHRLQAGEPHQDCDGRHHQHVVHNDSAVVGSSIVVSGAVKKNGVWTPFTLNEDLELQFTVKGNFTVQEATGSVTLALQFDLGQWFKDPSTGSFLDPSDTSGRTRAQIAMAVRRAFGAGRGGHDHNGDGHPDD